MADHEQHEDQPAHHVDEEKSIDTKPEEHTTEPTAEHTSQGGEHIHEEAPTTDSVDSSDHGMVSSIHHNSQTRRQTDIL